MACLEPLFQRQSRHEKFVGVFVCSLPQEMRQVNSFSGLSPQGGGYRVEAHKFMLGNAKCLFSVPCAMQSAAICCMSHTLSEFRAEHRHVPEGSNGML